MNNDKRLLFLSGLYLTLLITSNLMAIKVINIFGVLLPAAVICYPLCFAVNDLINEFYGFKTARIIIWFSFIFNAIATAFTTAAVFLPSSPMFSSDAAYRVVFLSTPRVLGASFTAFLISALLNSYVFNKIKQKTDYQAGFQGYKPRSLIFRSSLSTFFGTVLDSVFFITAAFIFIIPSDILIQMICWQILAKLLIGVGIGMPITLAVVKRFRHPKIFR